MDREKFKIAVTLPRDITDILNEKEEINQEKLRSLKKMISSPGWQEYINIINIQRFSCADTLLSSAFAEGESRHSVIPHPGILLAHQESVKGFLAGMLHCISYIQDYVADQQDQAKIENQEEENSD